MACTAESILHAQRPFGITCADKTRAVSDHPYNVRLLTSLLRTQFFSHILNSVLVSFPFDRQRRASRQLRGVPAR